MGLVGVSVIVGLVGVLLVSLAAVVLLLKAVLWVVLLPFRLLFAIPLLILKGLFVTVGIVIAGSLALVLAVAALAALVVPLVPVLFVVLLTWGLVRLMSRPATAQGRL